MKTSEIRELATAELTERIDTETAKYENMKFNHHVSPLEDNSQLKKARRDIARMKTELHARDLNK